MDSGTLAAVAAANATIIPEAITMRHMLGAARRARTAAEICVKN
jgi:hypothetical protein